MSSPMAVSCPHCGAGLKLKNNSFVGKKVPCPKCQKPFQVEQPPEDEFLSQDDDFGAMEEAEEEPEEPLPKSKSKGAKGGKGKKRSKGGGFAPIAMIAGGTVLGIGLLAGIVYGAMALFSGGGNTQPTVAAEPATAKDVAAAGAPKLGDSLTDITSYPGQVIDAGEKSKDKINALNDQHQADIAAQMQEGGSPATAAHAGTQPVPTGNDPAQVAHGSPPTPAGDPAGNAVESEAAKAMRLQAEAVAKAAENNPAQVAHAAPGAAAPEGAAAPMGDAAANGQTPEKPGVPKSRSRRKPTPK